MTAVCKYRAVPFTLNNYTEEECAGIISLKDHVLYIVVGKEVGSEGTPHLQGYLYFKNARTVSALHKMPGLARAHFSVPSKGTHYENMCYCAARGAHENKPGWKELLIESGKCPEQGQRTDLTMMIDACKAQATTAELIEEHTEVYAKYPKFTELCKRTYAKPRDPNNPPVVKCYWGKSETGKTRAAVAEGGDSYFKKGPSTGHWFTGYDGQNCVILDELDKGYLKLGDLLEILDRYPVSVLVHHGLVQFTPSLIIATANKHPSDWYPNCSKQERKGLVRRFTEIKKFGDSESESESESDDLID